jgi:hypothetical protein
MIPWMIGLPSWPIWSSIIPQGSNNNSRVSELAVVDCSLMICLPQIVPISGRLCHKRVDVITHCAHFLHGPAVTESRLHDVAAKAAQVTGGPKEVLFRFIKKTIPVLGIGHFVKHGKSIWLAMILWHPIWLACPAIAQADSRAGATAYGLLKIVFLSAQLKCVLAAFHRLCDRVANIRLINCAECFALAQNHLDYIFGIPVNSNVRVVSR